MNALARLIGGASRLYARVMLSWAETRYGKHAVRLWVYSNVLASSDEPALVGLAGKRRGHRITQPAELATWHVFWQRCGGAWMLYDLARRRGIVLDQWKPAQRHRRPMRQAAGL